MGLERIARRAFYAGKVIGSAAAGYLVYEATRESCPDSASAYGITTTLGCLGLLAFSPFRFLRHRRARIDEERNLSVTELINKVENRGHYEQNY